MFFARICRHVTLGRSLSQQLVSRLTKHGCWRGCKQLSSGHRCDKHRRQRVTLTNFSKFAQCCCKFLNRFQKLALNALQHCRYRKKKKTSATGCYTKTIFDATSYHCESALQIEQCNTTLTGVTKSPGQVFLSRKYPRDSIRGCGPRCNNVYCGIIL